MKCVYLLQHSYQYGEENEHNETKILGIFNSTSKAQQAIKFYKTLPGFINFTEDCFYIDKYELDQLEWKEGFDER